MREHSDTSWIVTSSDKRHEYYVTREGDGCQVQCCLKCTKCDICIHSYSCNCPDHLIHNTICMHIHLVVRFKQEKQEKPDMLHDHGPEFDIDPHSPPPVNEVGSERILCDCKGSKNSESEVLALREKLKENLSILCAHVNQCSSTVALLSAKSHVTSAINIIKSLNHTTTEIKLPHKTGPEPSNKNITPQRRFFSTKNKFKRPTVRLSKPSTEEKDKICTSLLNSGPLTEVAREGCLREQAVSYISIGLTT